MNSQISSDKIIFARYSYLVAFLNSSPPCHCIKSVRIQSCSGLYFAALNRIRGDTESVFSLNAGKYEQEKLRIKTLFTQREFLEQKYTYVGYFESKIVLSKILKDLRGKYPLAIYFG